MFSASCSPREVNVTAELTACYWSWCRLWGLPYTLHLHTLMLKKCSLTLWTCLIPFAFHTQNQSRLNVQTNTLPWSARPTLSLMSVTDQHSKESTERETAYYTRSPIIMVVFWLFRQFQKLSSNHCPWVTVQKEPFCSDFQSVGSFCIINVAKSTKEFHLNHIFSV